MIEVLPCSFVVVYNMNEVDSKNDCDDKNTRILHHLSFSSTDLKNLEEQKKERNWKKKCFLDEYFDDKENTLSKHNIWLRRRDIFNWCLKIARNSGNNVHFKEIHDKNEIMKVLEEKGCKPVPVDEIDKSVLSEHMRIRCDKMLTYCPVRIAFMPTSRWILDEDLHDSNFYIDSCYMKEKTFYNTATLSMKETSKSKLLNNKLDDFEDILHHPARSKVIQYLFVNNEELYDLLKSNGIIPSVAYQNSIMDTCLFPSLTVSPDEMEEIANFAVENHIDLENGSYIYHHSHEDRYEDKNPRRLTEGELESLKNALLK